MVKDEYKEHEARILLSALQRNMEHARHQESQRLSLFNFYAIIIAALISVLPLVGFVTWGTVYLIGFMSLLSLLLFLTFLKWNAEFANHIAASQWICEKLGLIEHMKADRQEEFKKRLDKNGFKEPKSYAYMDEGYMAFPLPLSIRVHELAFTWFPVGFAAMSLGIAIGLTAYLLVSASCISNYALPIALGPSSLSTITILLFCRRVVGRIKSEAGLYREFRKPREICA